MHHNIIIKNKRASFEYFLEDFFEAGIVLTGSEIKSIRAGNINIEEAHASGSLNEIFLYNCNISPYEKAAPLHKHEAKRPRKLLLHKKEIRKIIGRIKLKGYSLIPTKVFFNEKNLVKVEIALAKGKKLYDKRESIKKKEWIRSEERKNLKSE